MKEKKHIDALFKERFQNFEASPPPEVWANIQARLKEKKEEDRKVIPLWWKLAGVAALIALLLTIGNAFFTSEENTPAISNEVPAENKEHLKKEDSKKGSSGDAIISNPVDVASENENNTEETEKNASHKENVSGVNSDDAFNNKQKASKDAVAVQEKTSDKSLDHKTPSYKDKIPSETSKKERAAIASEKATDTEKALQKKIGEELIKKDIIISESTEPAIVQSNDKKTTEALEEPVETKKRSIFEAIEEAENTEDAIVKTNTPGNRWDVSPNVGPVYYNSFGNGSSIDPSFADNPQSGDVNFSYGMHIAYNISNRFSIRSGVSNVNLSYSTGGVELGTGPVASALRTVDYGNRTVVVTAVDKGSLSQNPDEGDPFGNITPKNTSEEATIHQNIKYYEIPLEATYALLKTRFGVHMIGGFSTLLLGNNEVSVSAGDFSSVLGEANNLNSVSFTTNVGLGFDYKISKKLKFNIEPMFKYQLNPYSDSSVDFKPYYLGIYSGLSFKF